MCMFCCTLAEVSPLAGLGACCRHLTRKHSITEHTMHTGVNTSRLWRHWLSILLLNTLYAHRCVYIAPVEALAKERAVDWGKKFGEGLGLKVVQLTGGCEPVA